MKKLADYFSKRKDKPTKGLEDFPEFSDQEDKEIRQVLNIRRRDADTRSVILETLTSFRELPIASSEKEGKEVAVVKPDADEDEEEDEEFATFRVNMAKRGLKNARTTKRKPEPTPAPAAPDDDDLDIYGTFRVKGGGDSDDDNDFGTFKAGQGTGDDDDSFLPVFRAPEDWELKILAIEKGEWIDEMANDNAFRRWKKERPKLRSSVFMQPLRKSVSARKSIGLSKGNISKTDATPQSSSSSSSSTSTPSSASSSTATPSASGAPKGKGVTLVVPPASNTPPRKSSNPPPQHPPSQPSKQPPTSAPTPGSPKVTFKAAQPSKQPPSSATSSAPAPTAKSPNVHFGSKPAAAPAVSITPPVAAAPKSGSKILQRWPPAAAEASGPPAPAPSRPPPHSSKVKIGPGKK